MKNNGKELINQKSEIEEVKKEVTEALGNVTTSVVEHVKDNPGKTALFIGSILTLPVSLPLSMGLGAIWGIARFNKEGKKEQKKQEGIIEIGTQVLEALDLKKPEEKTLTESIVNYGHTTLQGVSSLKDKVTENTSYMLSLYEEQQKINAENERKRKIQEEKDKEIDDLRQKELQKKRDVVKKNSDLEKVEWEKKKDVLMLGGKLESSIDEGYEVITVKTKEDLDKEKQALDKKNTKKSWF